MNISIFVGEKLPSKVYNLQQHDTLASLILPRFYWFDFSLATEPAPLLLLGILLRFLAGAAWMVGFEWI